MINLVKSCVFPFKRMASLMAQCGTVRSHIYAVIWNIDVDGTICKKMILIFTMISTYSNCIKLHFSQTCQIELLTQSQSVIRPIFRPCSDCFGMAHLFIFDSIEETNELSFLYVSKGI